MVVKMRLDVRAWDQLGKRFKNAATRYPRLKREFLENISEDAVRRILFMYGAVPPTWYRLPVEYHGAYAMGLRKTINVGPKRSFATVSVSPETVVAERGRGPGTQPPFEDIAQWAAEKLGIDTESKAGRRQVFAIMRNIGDNGTRGGWMLTRALSPTTASGRLFDQFISKEAERLLSDWMRLPMSDR
jgi:hypothetical protein